MTSISENVSYTDQQQVAFQMYKSGSFHIEFNFMAFTSTVDSYVLELTGQNNYKWSSGTRPYSGYNMINETITTIPIGSLQWKITINLTNRGDSSTYQKVYNGTVTINENKTATYTDSQTADPPVTEGPWFEGMENLTPSEDTLVMDVPEKE